MAKEQASWNSLRNQNALLTISTNGDFIVVPVTANPTDLIGFAVVRISDLSPKFKSQRDAQEWADKQGKNPTNQP